MLQLLNEIVHTFNFVQTRKFSSKNPSGTCAIFLPIQKDEITLNMLSRVVSHYLVEIRESSSTKRLCSLKIYTNIKCQMEYSIQFNVIIFNYEFCVLKLHKFEWIHVNAYGLLFKMKTTEFRRNQLRI